jgi:hypothetical protein
MLMDLILEEVEEGINPARDKPVIQVWHVLDKVRRAVHPCTLFLPRVLWAIEQLHLVLS